MEDFPNVRSDEHVRQRIAPRPGDPAYLHLSDLRLSLEAARSDDRVRILDYGCGGSPYRGLFANAEYRRADFGHSDSVDYVLSEEGRVAEKDASFDVILSTQVVEHVRDPSVHFAEAFRLLRDGGRLHCTTHGSYFDHASPYDFHRWTADGLRSDLERAGFHVARVWKLTTGPRAVLAILDRQSNPKIARMVLSASRRSIPGLLFWVLRGMFRHYRPRIHVQSDRYMSRYRVVEDGLADHDLYLCLDAMATKRS